MSIGARSAQGRISSATVCGRRNCGTCRCWRLVTDYTVDRWADKDKTKPAAFKRACNGCRARRERSIVERDQRVRQARRDACKRWRVRQGIQPAPCAWGCGRHAAAGMSICHACDDEGYGWVRLSGGSYVEESELASIGFDHGMSGLSMSSSLGRAMMC